MCGRYSLGVSGEVLAKAFRLANVPQLSLRYNIAPTQSVPIIRLEANGGRRLHLLHWGLIPSWANDPKIGNRLINARAESAPDAPAFRSAFRRRRCLVPADAFYEWQKVSARKQPYVIKMHDGSPFAFAGLWEAWRGKENQRIESFTILTTDPNDVIRPLHDRMPAIVDPKDYDAWLDPKHEDVESLQTILRPAPSQGMIAYPISGRVNNAKNDDVSIGQPVPI
jgi:putative SOS response-associated peptidase YedK